VGFPHYENTVTRHREKRPNIGGKNILIASVPLSRKELARSSVELAALLPDHTVYYKLRSEEYHNWRAHYPREFVTTPNLKVVDSSDRSIYDYFLLCDYVISTNSTALYEGLSCGLQAFILKTGRYEEVRTLFEGGYAFLVDSAEDMAEKILAETTSSNRLDRNSLFKDNSEDNLLKVINQLMGRNPGGSWKPEEGARRQERRRHAAEDICNREHTCLRRICNRVVGRGRGFHSYCYDELG
jgi:hypothetical protein